MLQYVSTTFIAGVLALLPLLITISVAWFFYTKLLIWFGPGSRFGKLPKLLAEKTAMHPVLAYFSIFGMVALLIFTIGILVKASTEKSISLFVDRIPVLKSIYGGTEQVVSALHFTESGVPSSFSKVLLIRYNNLSLMGIQTCREPLQLNGQSYLSAYIPNTPLPATGQLFLVPVEDARELDISVEEMMQLYLSMGSLADEKLNGELMPLDEIEPTLTPWDPDASPPVQDSP